MAAWYLSKVSRKSCVSVRGVNIHEVFSIITLPCMVLYQIIRFWGLKMCFVLEFTNRFQSNWNAIVIEYRWSTQVGSISFGFEEAIFSKCRNSDISGLVNKLEVTKLAFLLTLPISSEVEVLSTRPMRGEKHEDGRRIHAARIACVLDLQVRSSGC